MFFVQDNYFDEETFKAIQDYCQNEFKIVTVGEKDFSILETPSNLIPLLQKKGYELILTFIRNAHKDFDNEYRIHADNIINGQQTSLASVFYINNENEVSNHGTCFYRHKKYGIKLPENVSNEEFDRLITEDSNDLKKWIKQDTIKGIPNRMLTYDSNYFHSKHPNKIEKGVRKVLVCFYKTS